MLNPAPAVKDGAEINVRALETALHAAVYNYPELRATLDRQEENFVKVTDFSDLFSFEDLRGAGVRSTEDLWPRVEEQMGR